MSERIVNHGLANTVFACGECCHTETLTRMTDIRVAASIRASEEIGHAVMASPVTASDTVRCIACGGPMTSVAGDCVQADDGRPAPDMREVRKRFLRQVRRDPQLRRWDPERLWRAVERSISEGRERIEKPIPYGEGGDVGE